MGARLAATVLLKDPDTHLTVELPEGSTPEMRLAVLVTNPAAWEGGRAPATVARAAAAAGDGDQEPGGGGGNDDGDSEDEDSEDSSGDTPPADPTTQPTTKAPAKKTAAKRPSRGKAADQGTGGQ